MGRKMAQLVLMLQFGGTVKKRRKKGGETSASVAVLVSSRYGKPSRTKNAEGHFQGIRYVLEPYVKFSRTKKRKAKKTGGGGAL